MSFYITIQIVFLDTNPVTAEHHRYAVIDGQIDAVSASIIQSFIHTNPLSESPGVVDADERYDGF